MTTRDIRKAYDDLQKRYDERSTVNGITQDQQAALQGNSGTPSDSNRYLTELDGASYVVGPASAVDNNLAQFNLTTGKLIEDSGLSNTDVASAVSLKHTQGSDTGTSNATFAIGSLKFYGLSIQLADHDTVVLTTATANYPAHGFVQVCTTGVITESAEFEMGSDGNVNIIRGTANIVANVDTTAKFCLGTAASQNPLTIKNHLGATVQAIIEFRCR